MKRIITAFIATVILASSSNSQAIVNPPGPGRPGRPVVRHIILRSGGTPSRTGPNAPNSIRATPHAAGPSSGSPGAQMYSNPLLSQNKKIANQQVGSNRQDGKPGANQQANQGGAGAAGTTIVVPPAPAPEPPTQRASAPSAPPVSALPVGGKTAAGGN